MALDKVSKNTGFNPTCQNGSRAVLDRAVEEYINQDYRYKHFGSMLPIGCLLPIAGYVFNGPLIFTS